MAHTYKSAYDTIAPATRHMNARVIQRDRTTTQSLRGHLCRKHCEKVKIAERTVSATVAKNITIHSLATEIKFQQDLPSLAHELIEHEKKAVKQNESSCTVYMQKLP